MPILPRSKQRADRETLTIITSAIAITALFSVFFSLPLAAENTGIAKRHPLELPLPECQSVSTRYNAIGAAEYAKMQNLEEQLSKESVLKLQKNLLDFYSKLTGRWTGTMVDTLCQTNSLESKLQKHYELTRVENEISYKGHLNMRMSRVQMETRRGKYYPVSLKQTRNEYWGVRHLVALQRTDADTYVLHSQYRQAANNPLFAQSGASLQGSVTTFGRERQDILRLRGNTLEVSTRWYTNGYFTGSEFYQMHRSR